MGLKALYLPNENINNKVLTVGRGRPQEPAQWRWILRAWAQLDKWVFKQYSNSDLYCLVERKGHVGTMIMMGEE